MGWCTAGMEIELFEAAGFVHEYKEEAMSFYRPFFTSEETMTTFFRNIFNFEITSEAEGDRKYIPRRMMNQIQRFVSLANDIEQIRPGRDPLKILFFRVCLESLCSLSQKKKCDFFANIETYMSDEGKAYITDHFQLTSWKFESTDSTLDNFPQNVEIPLSLDELLYIIKSVRDISVHEGDYWSMKLFSDKADCPFITTLTTKEAIISSVKPNGKKITYGFTTSLDFQIFTYHFVRMCITYVEKYMHTHLLKA